MAVPNPAMIDLTEHVYDLDVPREDWIPSLLETGLPVFDHGQGVVATTYLHAHEDGKPVPTNFFVGSGPAHLSERLLKLGHAVDDETMSELNRSGVVTTLSAEAHRVSGGIASLEELVAPAKDVLAITAVDPNGVGLSLAIMLPERTALIGKDRQLWQMLGAHLVAGFRLRQSLQEMREAMGTQPPLPDNAEAVLDPKQFRITDAVGRATEGETGAFIRDAARLIDRARGRLRKEDPEEALSIWRALVDGRWSMVDWFDSDGRRFILAHPNPPHLRDPRGLDERERQVATYVGLGESNKLISYRLGISQALVSKALKSAMRKLGVKTRPQMVERLRGLPTIS
jgi:DNA-binding CsgD family transcriptional regulator